MLHEKFHYKSLDELAQRANELGAYLPLSENTAALQQPLDVNCPDGSVKRVANRIALQPMEGTDGTPDGAPGELTFRRYQRFAEGGAGLIWFEAVATAPEVRASAHQLRITEDNLDDFKRIVDMIKTTGLKHNGFEPVVIMQATNSGRYSKPHGYPEPLIAYNNPVLEDSPLDASRILSDDQLRAYEALFDPATRLAQQAGFDGVDVKCCHRYLACELLSAYTRPGEYGGSYENRTRFYKNAIRAAKSAAQGNFIITSRLNCYDGFPYPYGFGVDETSRGQAYSVETPSSPEPNLAEPQRLLTELHDEFGFHLLNVTMGNPYKNPHVNRPYDLGNYVPGEHPLTGESRLMSCLAALGKAHPELAIIGSGFSYPRQYSANLAAAMVEQGNVAMAGFGREAFAYPSFPNDLKADGKLDPRKVCISCGQCAVLLRHGIPAGCVVRDSSVYKRYEG